jgi:hypothetical protein
MLFFGYIAERGIITFKKGAFFGFLPFFAMFYLIYENFAKTTRSKISISLKHFSPSYPPNIYSFLPTLLIVWQALEDGFYPPTFGLLQTKLDVFKTYKSSNQEFPS